MLGSMLDGRNEQRLRRAAREAHAAEARGDDAGANEAWRRYRLISDAARDPDELLAEGIALSQIGISELETAHGELPDSRRDPAR